MAPNSLESYFGVGTESNAISIERPDRLAENHWMPISECVSRLNRAIADGDLSLCIGTAKELVEATAKVVWEARGQAVPNAQDFKSVVAEAHVLLERKPGVGPAIDAPVRDIAQGAKTIASELGPIRNDYGTGHGRAYVPIVAEELALISIDAALLWTRWALRRLQPLIAGSPTALVNDLASETFRRGVLTKRLLEARLPDLEIADQHLIGLAVARRSMRETFVVQEEGVEQCSETSDLAAWPIGYRVGLLEGLFLEVD